MFDAIIIGGGPAGATCALWLKMLGHHPMLIEKRPMLGGLQADSPYLNEWVPMLPHGTRGQQVAATMSDRLRRHGVKMALGCEVMQARRASVDLFHIETSTGAHQARYLVLASGVRAATGGLQAAFDTLIGPGQQVASADFVGRSVAILGGGDNAFENYLFVRGRGARQVTIFARSLKARADFLGQVPAEDIRLGNYAVDAERRQVNGKTFDKLIILYGWEAHLPYMAEIPLALNERGFVITGTDCETSQRHVFAIGEITQRSHPCCITSMADGVVAAKAIQERLEQGAFARFAGMAKRAAGMAASLSNRGMPGSASPKAADMPQHVEH
jgi:thioredoxin reductase (NADPH)